MFTLVKLAPFPSPRVLIRRWEAGEIKRDELQRLMAEHQRAILEEADEVLQNPVAAFVEGVWNKRVAKRLIQQHGEAAVRECFAALSEVEDFPPSAFLWNAEHWDVPLHCFIRTKRGPVFRVKEMKVRSDRTEVLVEHGEVKKLLKERFVLKRHWKGELVVISRVAP